MQIFKPIYWYIRVLTLSVIAAGLVSFIYKTNDWWLMIFGILIILPSVIGRAKLAVDRGRYISYSAFRPWGTVDLYDLAECQCRIDMGVRRLPQNRFFISDRKGNRLDFSAHGWNQKSKLYEILNNGVRVSNISIDDKTAKILGLETTSSKV